MLLILTSLCKSDLKDMIVTLNRVIMEDLYIQTYIFVARYITIISPLLRLDMTGCSSSSIKGMITIYLNTYLAKGYHCYILLKMAQLVEHRGITTNHANMELTQPRRLRQQ